MPQVPLTKNMFAEVDEIDYEAVMAVGRWCATKSGYAVLYWRDSKGRHTLYLHRLIFARVLGHAIPPKLQVDHISAREKGRAARLDNRRSNLRLSTVSQNQAAKGDQKNSSTGQKGVRLRLGKYDVRLRYKGIRLHLGRYPDFELAVAVYAYTHQTLWKEFTSEADHSISLPDGIKKLLDQQIASVRKP